MANDQNATGLRNAIIRLAHENPDGIRAHLLPLVRRTKSGSRINLRPIRSKRGPTYKIKIDAVFGQIAVHGETNPVYIGIDRIDFRLVNTILETQIFRSDGSGKPVPRGVRMKIEKAVLVRLKTLEAEVEAERAG